MMRDLRWRGWVSPLQHQAQLEAIAALTAAGRARAEQREPVWYGGGKLAVDLSWPGLAPSPAGPHQEDIRTWCSICGVPDQAADLTAALRSIDSMYVE